MKDILAGIRRIDGVDGLLEAVREGRGAAVVGPVDSGAAAISAVLMEATAGPVLAVCPGVEYAEEFAEDVNLVKEGMACQFPALEILPGDEEPPNEALVKSRLSVLRHLVFGTIERGGSDLLEPEPQTRLVTASINALLQPVCSAERLQQGARTVAVGQEVTPRQLVEWLVESGFYSVPQVEGPGQYSLRGGILDIYSHGTESPVRLEFFGDEVDSIRTFDPETQLSRERVRSCQMMGPGDPLQDPTAGESNLLEYMAADAVVILVEPGHIWHRAEELRSDAESRRGLADPEELRDLIDARREVQFGEPDEELGVEPIGIECRRRDVFGVDLDSALDELQRICADYEDVFLLCMSRAEEERLRGLLEERDTGMEERIEFRRGRLNHGALFPEDGLALIPHHRLFGRYRQRRTVRHAAKEARPVTEAGQLSPGDTVVHVQHGIGRFRGLEVIERHGREQEHLEIEFADDVRVYVPSDRIDMVHRYIGVGGAEPALSKLHGTRWRKQRKKAQEATEDLAAELLRLQAAREASEGISFPPDGEWQRQFEAEFPYEETEDQLQAIQRTKSDMEMSRPMDRLICGEVGYGKTEVAMRAAFKAVMGERQVAVLVPTTVLAQQHYRTFGERMADYPIRVEMLSRFVSGAETREILEEMAAGRVDIVVGTHKLLQDDVGFRELGLVIIDEEQRFGVRHKEKLKQMRTSVDVLTLTATPIPRTLHMALMGLRDISALQTAPRERQAVETRVKNFDPDTLRHAVRRELSREGQVYLVHNRVHSIQGVAQKVHELVPEATVEIGHGQMPENELADVMERFTDGEVDVLVSTTIIENGLDIPNANTLIVSRAELLGLAEMHQLRGRVGRYIHKAYAYFFTPPDRPITPEAKERLKAIRRYSSLGAGFDIALRDLELRGAGNILGPQQSGHIAAVGYNLYCRLLERATARLKGESTSEPPTTTVNIGLDVVLPEDYVPALRNRMDLYREVSQVTDREDLREVARHLRDRFGPPPRPVRNLLLEAELRILAQEAGADSVHLRDGAIRFGIRELDRFREHFERAGVHPRVREPDMLAKIDAPSGGDALAVGRFLRRILAPDGGGGAEATPAWAEP